jgi:hypothetical protein
MPPGTGGSAQLDLFVDGAGTVLLNDVAASLAAGRPGAAHEALERLRVHDPGHPDLAGLQRLCAALGPGIPPPVSPTALDALIQEIGVVLWPQAERLLGPGAAAALGPVWHRLAEGARATGLARLRHAGAGCYWIGVAHYHLGRPREARRLWLRLAWEDPAELATFGPRWPDATLRQAWAAFERNPGFDAPDDVATAARWFPAWVFVRQRELAGLFGADEVPGTGPPAAAARCVLALLPREAQGLSDEVVRGRRALQAVAPGFFRYYLRSVGR